MTVEDLNPDDLPLTPITHSNLKSLAQALSVLEKQRGRGFIVTSGLRDRETQTRINPKNPKSAHLEGLAVDVLDSNGEVWDWLIENLDLVADLGFYLESKAYTKTWVHLQMRPPRSNNRIFIPVLAVALSQVFFS